MKAVLALFTWFLLAKKIKTQIGSASPAFMKTAYCACACCEDVPEKCYRHPSIEKDYNCVRNDCTEDFCIKWKQAKCHTNCYCSKCKDKLPEDDYRCNLYESVGPDCDCGDPGKIVCDTDEEDPEVAEVRKNLEEKSKCLVSCYCKKCPNVPQLFKSECEKAEKPTAECECENTICPTPQQMEQFMKLQSASEEELEQLTKTIVDEINVEEISDEEVSEINERLRPYIETGKAQPLTKHSLKKTKCQVQCFCDACRWDNPNMEEKCTQMVKKRMESCPPCPQNITCPELTSDANCKPYCFCLKCGKDERMPSALKEKCGEMVKSQSEICPCEEDVDCNVLGQLDSMQTSTLESTSEKGKAKPGKLKQKHKMWDEL